MGLIFRIHIRARLCCNENIYRPFCCPQPMSDIQYICWLYSTKYSPNSTYIHTIHTYIVAVATFYTPHRFDICECIAHINVARLYMKSTCTKREQFSKGTSDLDRSARRDKLSYTILQAQAHFTKCLAS